MRSKVKRQFLKLDGFKLLLMFVFVIPPYTQIQYDPINTADVITSVLSKPTFYMVSFIGLIFGIMNMLTWFVLQNQNWWMGVLHLPLLILSAYGLILCREKDVQRSTYESKAV